MDEKDVNLLKSKKGSWTHPTPLGIVRRRPPQFYNILCHNENFYAIELLNSPQIFLKLLFTPNSMTSDALLGGLPPQRKGRKPRLAGAHGFLRERIAKLFRYCRIMLKYAEMPSHGRLGKALCAMDGA